MSKRTNKLSRWPRRLWPFTKAQNRLMRKHGTPSEFAEGCYAAVPEISMDEAAVAIQKYNDEWTRAGKDGR